MINKILTPVMRIFSLSLIMLCLIELNAYAEIKVKVVKTNSGPKITVNDAFVSPRMFWGGNRGGTVNVTEEWQEFHFDVNVNFSANATWHFRFGNEAGEVWIYDIAITNLSTGKTVFPMNSFSTLQNFNSSWNVYPPDSKNTVGTFAFIDSALHLTLSNPTDGGNWPDFHFYSNAITLQPNITYRYSFKMRADKERSVSPQVYHVANSSWTLIGSPSSVFFDQIEMAKNAGVNFITFNVSNCWLPPTKAQNWLPIDVACKQILTVNPNALLIPRVSMDAPAWWLTENPGAVMVFEDGTKETMASISDRKYREDAANHLEKLAKHLRETFPDNLAGIHPSGQNTGEWFYSGSGGSKLSGYDSSTAAAWRNYVNGSSTVPSVDSRRIAATRMLLNYEHDKELIDFNHFLQDEMADFIITLSDAARRGLGDDKVIMFFYGYQYELSSVYNGPAASGHYALRKILEAPDIDILCAPVSYTDRKLTGSGPAMSSVESVLRAGRLWLNEDDTRTYLSTNLVDKAKYGGLNTQDETKTVLLRNAAQSALRGFGNWWMDHGAGTVGGWFADPELWKVMEEVEELDKEMFKRSDYFNPQVALIIDEESMLHIAAGSATLGRNLFYNVRESIARTGTTYGQYMLNDELNGNIRSKLKIFLATWALDSEKREALIKSRKKDDIRIWCYAPGYISPEGRSFATMKELTGFNFRQIEINSSVATPTEKGNEYGIINSWGPAGRVSPLFTVNDDSVIVLANYANTTIPAAAIKETESGTDIFIGTPQLTTEIIRALGEHYGVKFYADENINVWSAENYLAFHSAKDSLVNFSVNNNNSLIIDAINGEQFGTNPDFSINVKAGETRLLKWNSSTDFSSNDNQLKEYRLNQNYPNPFNPITQIEYTIPLESYVEIEVINLLGQRVDVLVNETKSAGNFKTIWKANSLPSGTYFIRIKATAINSEKSFLQVKKAMLIK